MELDRILGQNMAERLANAVPDESTISSRVEDIRDALLDYQVRVHLTSLFSVEPKSSGIITATVATNSTRVDRKYILHSLILFC